MDWAAKMFGLHNTFWNANRVGATGGAIQVRYCFSPAPMQTQFSLFCFLEDYRF